MVELEIPNLFHFIWLRNKIPLPANKSFCDWDQHFGFCWRNQGLDHFFQVILWVDESCLNKLQETGTIYKVPQIQHNPEIGYDPGIRYNRLRAITDRLGAYKLTPICFYSPFGRFRIVIPVCFYKDAFDENTGILQAAIDHELKNFVQSASDILRMLILYKFGGIYSDCSQIQPQRFGSFFSSKKVQFIDRGGYQPGVVEYQTSELVPFENGLIIAQQKSPNLEICLKEMKKFYNENLGTSLREYREYRESLGGPFPWSPNPPPFPFERFDAAPEIAEQISQRMTIPDPKHPDYNKYNKYFQHLVSGDSAEAADELERLDYYFKYSETKLDYNTEANLQAFFEAIYCRERKGMEIFKNFPFYIDLWNRFYKQYFKFEAGLNSWMYPGVGRVESLKSAYKIFSDLVYSRKIYPNSSYLKLFIRYLRRFF